MLRNHLRLSIAALAIACMFGAATPDQRRITLAKGPELQKLDRFIGEWAGELKRVRAGGGEMVLHPRIVFTWEVGGVWLRGRDTTTLPNEEIIENNTWLTWHRAQSNYHGAWQDNVFPAMVSFTAEWTEEDTLTFDTGKTEINGRPHRIVMTYTFDGDDSFATEMRQSWDDGPLDVVVTGAYERVKEVN